MEVYVAVLRKNEYDEEEFNIGVYSTKEKAERAILLELLELDSDAPLLSLEFYQAQEDPYYDFWVETYTLDK